MEDKRRKRVVSLTFEINLNFEKKKLSHKVLYARESSSHTL